MTVLRAFIPTPRLRVSFQLSKIRRTGAFAELSELSPSRKGTPSFLYDLFGVSAEGWGNGCSPGAPLSRPVAEAVPGGVADGGFWPFTVHRCRLSCWPPRPLDAG